MVLMKKAVVIIQKYYRMHLAHKKYNVIRIHRLLLINRINRAVRRYLKKNKSEQNNAAHKIQLLLKKNKLDTDKLFNISISSKGYLNKKDPSRNLAATIIQRYWKAYYLEKLDLILDENDLIDYKKNRLILTEVDSSVPLKGLTYKVKLCNICSIEKMSYLCKDVIFIK
jgi:hypothetical protein